MVMPYLSESMEEGTILRWLKTPGDEVAFGDDLVEIETDKATAVYQSDTAGILLEVLVPEGESIEAGGVIARIGSADESQGRSGER
jgi:pyruvate dehydrogenase E2 component (dihydrolipoamide acetyltransferase)